MTKRETALQLLIEERDGINRAIAALEGTGATGGKRRGRPRKVDAIAENTATAIAPPAAARRKFSAATRKKMAAAQRARHDAKLQTTAIPAAEPAPVAELAPLPVKRSHKAKAKSKRVTARAKKAAAPEKAMTAEG